MKSFGRTALWPLFAALSLASAGAQSTPRPPPVLLPPVDHPATAGHLLPGAPTNAAEIRARDQALFRQDVEAHERARSETPQLYLGQQSRISDFGRYSLAPPPPDTKWVRYGSDALLVDDKSGTVIRTQTGVFAHTQSPSPPPEEKVTPPPAP